MTTQENTPVSSPVAVPAQAAAAPANPASAGEPAGEPFQLSPAARKAELKKVRNNFLGAHAQLLSKYNELGAALTPSIHFAAHKGAKIPWD